LTEKMLAALTSVALFILHVALILACAVSLQPVDRAAQLLAYSAAVRLSLVVHALRLARRCPLPRSLPDLPRFLQDAGGTTESFYIFGDFILLSNPSGSLILASQALLAVYHALSYGRSLGPLGKPVQQVARVAAAHRETALFAMGFLDIMAFLQLMLYALTGGAGIRAFVQSFIYLNLVKSRSASDSPETSYYSPVWNAIGRSAVGAAAKRLPFFESVRRWFQSGTAVA